MNTLQKTIYSARGIALLWLAGAAVAFGQGDNVRPPLRPVAGLKPDASSIEIFNAFHLGRSQSDLRQYQMDRPPVTPVRSGAAIFPNEFRTIDGSGNNQTNPLLGAADTPYLRNTTIGYADGLGSPGGANEKGAREISNLVNAQSDLITNSKNVTDFVWQWGQFIDHDMTFSATAVPAEPFNIPVPACDPVYDPGCTGTKTLAFQRSLFVNDINGVRQQVNGNTAFLDASMVYGSDTARAQALRTLDGTGHLKTGDNNLLPFNVDRIPNQPTNSASFFVGGDIRVNEQSAVCSMHTLFMREHNFWADSFHAGDPTLDDDGLYFRARAMVGAEIQVITYRDFLPLILGKNALPTYTGYNPAVDPSIANVFATSAYRFGHSMLPPQLRRLDSNNNTIPEGDITMHDAFFNPASITGADLGIEVYLRGMAKQQPQEIDAYIVDALRCFLNGLVGQGGFDLAALNIQRLRDHGMPGYNQVRLDYGLAAKTSFADITSDTTLQGKLASAYPTVDDIDIWVGALCEDHRGGAMMGQTMTVILKDQFQRLRDGDRFWYQSYFDAGTVRLLEKTKLSTIIKRNTTIKNELQSNVFQLPKQ